jgi:acyl carrier protein
MLKAKRREAYRERQGNGRWVQPKTAGACRGSRNPRRSRAVFCHERVVDIAADFGFFPRSLRIRRQRQDMTKEDIHKIVLDIIADIAPDEDISGLKTDVRLRDQLSLDSMDFLDIVMELRKRHGIEVPETDYLQLASLRSCGEYLLPKFQEKRL